MSRRRPDRRWPAMPAELVAGPEVTQWALPAHLAELDNLAKGSSDRGELVWQAKASAYRRWREALWSWADEHAVPHRAARAQVARFLPYRLR